MNKSEYEKILGNYADLLKADGMSETTISLYTSQVRQAFKSHAFDSISNLNEFINSRRKELADNSFNSQIDALSSFSKSVEFMKYDISKNILTRIKHITSSARISNPTLVQERRAYTTEEIAAIMDLDLPAWRYHYIFIALNFGLRSKEIRNLRFSDIDLKKRILVVRAKVSKNKRSRYIPISKSVYPTIKTWSDLRENRQTYYIENSGQPYSARSCQLWDKYEAKLGFKILSHNFRYTFATQLWLRTQNILLIQKYLGHSSPEVTWSYLKLRREHLDQEFLDLNFKVIG